MEQQPEFSTMDIELAASSGGIKKAMTEGSAAYDMFEFEVLPTGETARTNVVTAVKPKPRLALSFDVEATGDAPGKGSMVQLGITAILEDQPEGFEITEENAYQWIIAQKKWSLEELDGRGERCWNEFWTKQQHVWEDIQKNKVHPSVAMKELNEWLKELSKTYKVTWFAWPAAFDWQWVNYTWVHYGPAEEDRINIGYKAECMNGLENMVAILGHDQTLFDKFVTPVKLVATHDALEDSVCQAFTYLKMKEWFKTSH